MGISYITEFPPHFRSQPYKTHTHFFLNKLNRLLLT